MHYRSRDVSHSCYLWLTAGPYHVGALWLDTPQATIMKQADDLWSEESARLTQFYMMKLSRGQKSSGSSLVFHPGSSWCTQCAFLETSVLFTQRKAQACSLGFFGGMYFQDLKVLAFQKVSEDFHYFIIFLLLKNLVVFNAVEAVPALFWM